MRTPTIRGTGDWQLRLVCCGRDDGIERFSTWDEADKFRQGYEASGSPHGYSDPPYRSGHQRAAILGRTP